MSSSHAWRRSHGPDIVAQVIPDGRGAWAAKVWLAGNPTVMVTVPRGVEQLATAQEKADRLARKTFDHHCDERCGQWRAEADPHRGPVT
jgi:hypothetical protein